MTNSPQQSISDAPISEDFSDNLSETFSEFFSDNLSEVFSDDFFKVLPQRALLVIGTSQAGMKLAPIAQTIEQHAPGAQLLNAGTIGDWQASDAPKKPAHCVFLLVHEGCPPTQIHRLAGLVLTVFKAKNIVIFHEN